MATAIYGLRVSEARKRLGLSQGALGEKVSRSQGFISDIEAGRTDPSFDFLVKLWSSCGIDPSWIVSGEGEAFVSSRSFPGRTFHVEPADYTRPLHGDLEIEGLDYSLVKRFDVSVAAGSGRIAYDEATIGHVAFSTRWLKELGLVADLSGLVSVTGESMMPTISDGALALVDFRAKTIESGKIFVFRMGDEVMVKRLFLIQDDGNIGISISSDNLYFPPLRLFGESAEGVHPIAKVRAIINPV